MPIREYRLKPGARGCDQCRQGFERLESIPDEPLKQCPACGAPVIREWSAPKVGLSRSGLDDRAKEKGFTKLRRLGRGEYEKEY
ncbi:FmdB family zinc ribbon protein [Kiritimatiella glycovorans]|uniref:Putative regulatory protein, FmdB family n=1 Tax=Kiritimatiella glycovorans TaxID=1307763 RepID=A0A0G3EFH6_9BACT|nr:FmdB family zinc ribbon protein [Kiritimatiella glycovorans]AKJ64157.1 putative regulatory protein, FmdB family [Kiritimatiella glycovorans]